MDMERAAAGNYVYLIDYSGLKIIDVSVPGSPVLVGVIDTRATLMT